MPGGLGLSFIHGAGGQRAQLPVPRDQAHGRSRRDRATRHPANKALAAVRAHGHGGPRDGRARVQRAHRGDGLPRHAGRPPVRVVRGRAQRDPGRRTVRRATALAEQLRHAYTARAHRAPLGARLVRGGRLVVLVRRHQRGKSAEQLDVRARRPGRGERRRRRSDRVHVPRRNPGLALLGVPCGALARRRLRTRVQCARVRATALVARAHAPLLLWRRVRRGARRPIQGDRIVRPFERGARLSGPPSRDSRRGLSQPVGSPSRDRRLALRSGRRPLGRLVDCGRRPTSPRACIGWSHAARQPRQRQHWGSR
mmetsp:Transcript_62192/g.185066  ORF Transcript_62192/g.185066 Transcript_62192/m.185066 type:complete len:311 (+) Transcript_62192:1203-2135(+)